MYVRNEHQRQRSKVCMLSLLQRVELCVSGIEVHVHNAMERDVDFLSVILIRDGVSLLAQPMPDK